VSVTITWKQASVEITQPLDHGSGSNGDTLTAQEVSISHDGSNQITNCKFYLAAYSGTYTGGATAAADLAEIIAWGDSQATAPGDTAADFGGLQLNMNAAGGFPSGDWPTHATKSGANFNVFRTGAGNSSVNAITLPIAMGGGMVTDGVIPAGGEVSFRCRVQLPTNEDTVGARQVDQKLRFTYTS
jgi:hypothetical protein